MSEAPELESINVGFAEAHKLCGVGRHTFQRWLEESLTTSDPMPFVRVSQTQRRFPVRELRDWMARKAKRDSEAARQAVMKVRLDVDSRR